jgi:hypothetical protein
MISEPHRTVRSALAVAFSFSMVATTACTALGPMPATTAIAPLPAGRPSLEVGVGALPGYYLSSGVQEKPKGTPISQAALLVEPDSIIRVPGLVVGGRYVGNAANGGYPEPMLGYRTFLDDDKRLAMSAVGYATHASGSAKGASYSATRGGAEAGIEFRVTPESKALELHLLAAASPTGLSANGRYCLDAQGTFGVDCPDMAPSPRAASAGGFYPAAVGGMSLDVGRHLNGEFHGGRLALMVGGGTMPTVVNAAQASAHGYGAAGLALSVGFGEGR